MPRTMLQLRVEALSQHLEQAQDPSVWKQRLDLPQFNVEERLWSFAVGKIHTEAAALKRKLDELERTLRTGELDEQEGWRRYAELQAASAAVFRECLDLLGGLALRDRIQDEQICRIADQYIWELSTDTKQRRSFSIPGLDPRVFSTLRRVVTMQFPEWTLWTLPLVAYEYAHVVIEETGLRKFADELAEDRVVEVVEAGHPIATQLAARGLDARAAVSWLRASGPSPLRQLLAPAEQDPEQHARMAVDQLAAVIRHEEQRLRVLLADALATLLAGPAYAYAALLLRLNPWHSSAAAAPGLEAAALTAEATVSDQDRAATVLGTLEVMNAPVDGAAPHDDVVQRLAAYWQASVTAVSPPPCAGEGGQHEAGQDEAGRDEAGREEPLPLRPVDPEQVREAFRDHIVSPRRALYARHDSARALEWSKAWQDQMSDGVPLRRPQFQPGEHIREAVNAAWRARIALTVDLEPSEAGRAQTRVEALERAGLDLCDAIIRARTEEAPAGGHLPPAQRPVGRVP